jgi:hypothetical protein
MYCGSTRREFLLRTLKVGLYTEKSKYFRTFRRNKRSADTQDVEKTAENNVSFKLPHPTTCRSCSMQFESNDSNTYYHEVCALSSACTGFLADHVEATCVMQNHTQYANRYNDIRFRYPIKPKTGYFAFHRPVKHEIGKRRKW